MKVPRSLLLKVLVHCGWKSAAKWDNAKLLAKIPGIPDVVPTESHEDPAVQSLLTDILDGIKNKVEFDVVSDTAEEPKKTEEPKKVENATEATTSTEAAAKPPKSTESAKAEKEPAKGRVRPGKTASYYVGRIFAKFGLDNGVTDEMIAEYGKLRGKENKEVAEANLVWGFHVVNGFVNDLDKTTEPTETQS